MLAALNEVATPNGPVNGLAPLPVPAPVVPSSAGPNDIVITKGTGLESGWGSWSWGTDFDGAFIGVPAAPVGSSVIKATSTNYGGLSLKGVVFAHPGFESVHFKFAPSSATPQLTVRMESTVEANYVSVEIPIATVCPAAFVANQFQNCKVDLTTLGAHQWNRISLMSKTSASQVIFVADMFAKKTPPATTAAPVTTTTAAAPAGVSPQVVTITATQTVVSTLTQPVTTTKTEISTAVFTETLTEQITNTHTLIVPTTTTSTATATVTPAGHLCFLECNKGSPAQSGCSADEHCLRVGGNPVCVLKNGM